MLQQEVVAGGWDDPADKVWWSGPRRQGPAPRPTPHGLEAPDTARPHHPHRTTPGLNTSSPRDTLAVCSFEKVGKPRQACVCGQGDSAEVRQVGVRPDTGPGQAEAGWRITSAETEVTCMCGRPPRARRPQSAQPHGRLGGERPRPPRCLIPPSPAAQRLRRGAWKPTEREGAGAGVLAQPWRGGAEGRLGASSPVDEGLVLAAVVLDLEHPHGVRWPPGPPAHQP